MQAIKIIPYLLIATFSAAQLGACAATSGERATGQVLDDSVITTKVKAALVTDASLGTAANVNVTTYRGEVQLSGFVDSEQVAQRAVIIAQDVPGVRSVRNDLRVTTSSR